MMNQKEMKQNAVKYQLQHKTSELCFIPEFIITGVDMI
jgi:hypothetical protein